MKQSYLPETRCVLQVPVPQQPATVEADSDDEGGEGVNSCGVQTARNFKVFMEGVEQYCAPSRSSRRGSANGLQLGWVTPHMGATVTPLVMEQARGTAMRTALSACVQCKGVVSGQEAGEMLMLTFKKGRWFKKGKVESSAEWAPSWA